MKQKLSEISGIVRELFGILAGVLLIALIIAFCLFVVGLLYVMFKEATKIVYESAHLVCFTTLNAKMVAFHP